MIQMGGLSTFSPLAALKIKSFFNGSKEGILVLGNLERLRGSRETGGDGARVSWGPASGHGIFQGLETRCLGKIKNERL